MSETLVVTGPTFAEVAPSALQVLPTGAGGTSALGDLLAPQFGNQFYVNETTGADTNPGTSFKQPLATLSAALGKCTAEHNDVVFFEGTVHLTAALAWNKNQTHLIGVCNGIRRGKRARISVSGTTGFDNLIAVTASGCLFRNFGTFYGWTNTAGALHCITDTGGRNCYDNVEILGFGDATTSTGSSNLTGSRAFLLNTSTGETTFSNCVFGVDTTVRNATNYTVEIAGGAPRVTFISCDFESDLGSSGGGASHVLIGASGIDRYCSFVTCRFMSSTKSGGTAMAQVFNVNAAAGGFVILDRCTAFGATHWETTASSCVVLDMGTVTAHDGGIAVAASPA